jgi:hypothetical protein
MSNNPPIFLNILVPPHILDEPGAFLVYSKLLSHNVKVAVQRKLTPYPGKWNETPFFPSVRAADDEARLVELAVYLPHSPSLNNLTDAMADAFWHRINGTDEEGLADSASVWDYRDWKAEVTNEPVPPLKEHPAWHGVIHFYQPLERVLISSPLFQE